MKAKRPSVLERRAQIRRIAQRIAGGLKLTAGERAVAFKVLEAAADHGLKGVIPKESAFAKRKEHERQLLCVVYYTSLIYAPVSHGQKEARAGTVAEKFALERKTVLRALAQEGDYMRLNIDLVAKSPEQLARRGELACKQLGTRGAAAWAWLRGLKRDSPAKPRLV